MSIVWTIYGLYDMDWVVIITDVLIGIQVIILIGFKYYYDRKNNRTKNFRQKFLLASSDIRKNFGNLSDPNTNFFDQYVSIKFISIPTKNSINDSINIEAMALAAFKIQFNEFPNLNKIDEAKGLNGFFD